MTPFRPPGTIEPDPSRHAAYSRLYSEYVHLHDWFGRGGNEVMRRLASLRRKVMADAHAEKSSFLPVNRLTVRGRDIFGIPSWCRGSVAPAPPPPRTPIVRPPRTPFPTPP